MTITLPWPPSVNRYWRAIKGRAILSAEARKYRETTRLAVGLQACNHETLLGRLTVRIALYPPDRRRRDIDNSCKALLDALEHAEVYGDDSQIDRLAIERRDVDRKKPRAVVEIENA